MAADKKKKKTKALSGRWSEDKAKQKEHLILAPVTRESYVPTKVTTYKKIIKHKLVCKAE